MTEIRGIHRSEAREFLRILCHVFELDFHRAEGIFYNEPLFDLDRKWALFEGGQMRSILTTVPLEFGWGRAYGIAGVATLPEHRGRGLAGQLLDHVFKAACARDEGAGLLFAREPGLYARHGFELLDEVVRVPLEGFGSKSEPRILAFSEVTERYATWAVQDPSRLRRDERRWQYWRWTLRMCTEFADGYLCFEGNLLREAVASQAPTSWPVEGSVEWLGLREMGRPLGVRVEGAAPELFLMGRAVPSRPQMFLTDQF